MHIRLLLLFSTMCLVLFTGCSSISAPEKAVYSLSADEVVTSDQAERIGDALSL
ncbi:hypothetical protein [Rhodohalobacter mucosus]|uniref:hypothetical protein n=1 Tax=Rhodohalobacter mucosus TaxID=2079485 RepID=UPI00130492AD|nr:hypothetical protein [Rhodohalobacter mucosus]